MKKLLLIIALIYTSMQLLFSQTIGLEIGNTSPEIKLPNPKGETIALSALKGKVILIDFWATWCVPCVREQDELAELYKVYKSSVFTNGKGFEIFGVSLDNKKAAWESAIKRMNIDWIQVSDLKFWASPVAKTYDIQALPFNVLIDDKGIIIAKDLHGNDLKHFIANLQIK